MDDNEAQFENWKRLAVNHLLGAADSFKEMILLASTGVEVGRMIHNIDMLVGEAADWMPDGCEWPKDENGTPSIITIDFQRRCRI